MNITTDVFFGIWGSLLIAWLSLIPVYKSKYDKCRESIAGEIRSYNSRNGYDRSVGKMELASDYLIPFRSARLEKFASYNDTSLKAYNRELRENVGTSLVIWNILFYSLCLVYALAGVAYLYIDGFFSPANYLIVSVVLFGLNAAIYWIS